MTQHDFKLEPVGFLPLVIEETHLAEILGVSARVMRSLRQRGLGPAPIRIGRNTVYLRDCVMHWLTSSAHQEMAQELPHS